MAGAQSNNENRLEQLHAAWENARREFGEGSPESATALELYTAFLLEMGEKPAESEKTARFILASGAPRPDSSRQIAPQHEHCKGNAVEESAPLPGGIRAGDLLKDRYRVLHWLGQGGMSRVYLVTDEILQKNMALKIVHANLRNDTDTLEQFAREVKVGTLLSHPNLIRVHDFVMDADACPFMVMDYLEGFTLAQLLARNGYFSAESCINIFLQVCDALEHAHSHCIIHSDVKPSNILVAQSGVDGPEPLLVKVLDFGFARILNEDNGAAQPQSHALDVFGTPHYMSPEQCQGLCVDARSDIYSLASVMFEALSGSPPFSGSTAEIVNKHLYEYPGRIENPALEDQHLLKALELIVLRSLAKEPADRCQSMAAFKAELSKLQPARKNPGLIDRLLKGFGSKSSKRRSS